MSQVPNSHLCTLRNGKNFTKDRMGAQLSASLILGLALAASAQARYAIRDEDAMGEGSPKVVVLHDTVAGAGAEAAITPSSGPEISNFKVTRQGKMIELLYNARDYASPPGVFHGCGPLLWPDVGMQYPVTTVPKENCGHGVVYRRWKKLSDAMSRFCQRHAVERNSALRRFTWSAGDGGTERFSGDRRWVALMLMSQCHWPDTRVNHSHV